MLVGAAIGVVAGIAAAVVTAAPMRPDAVIAVVVGVPTVVGLGLVLAARRRATATLGVLVLSLAPGWFGALAAIEVVSGG